MGKAIDEPSLVYVSISTFLAVLELKNSTEAMEVLGVRQDLPFIDVVIVLADADELQLKTIWLMDDGRSVSIVHVVVGLDSSVTPRPVLLSDKKLSGSWPRLELDVLLNILSKVLGDKAVVFASIEAVKQG